MNKKPWWKLAKDELCQAVTSNIAEIETTYADSFERSYRLAWRYDSNDYISRVYNARRPVVTENVCAALVDTVTSMIARLKTRPVFLTDEADFKQKRKARDLGRYAEGLAKVVRLDVIKPRVFKDGAIFGTGILRFEIDAEGNLAYERFLPVEVRVNELESLTSSPRSIHLTKHRDREWLMAKYPKFAAELETHASSPPSFAMDSRPDSLEQIAVRESYHLPIREKGQDGYVPGRRVVTTEKLVLEDVPYELDRFPLAILRWNERTTGFFGKGLIEDTEGTQATINKQNAAMDAQIDQYASPITYVHTADVAMSEKIKKTAYNRIVPYTHDKPSVSIPPVIANEVIGRQEYLKRSAMEMSGVSGMHSHGEMPLKRAETGAAIEQLNDVTSERFSIQELAAERWYLDCIEMMLYLIKDNVSRGLKAPVIGYAFGNIAKRINWKQVDLKDVAYQIQAAPQLSRTLYGRYQQITEWANQGVISQDEARHLLNHPDLDDAMSLYDAQREYIDKLAESLLDGNLIPPDPRCNLQLSLNWMVMAYFKALNDNIPEEDVENIRTWCDQASFLIAKAAPPPAPQSQMPIGQLPAAPGMQ